VKETGLDTRMIKPTAAVGARGFMLWVRVDDRVVRAVSSRGRAASVGILIGAVLLLLQDPALAEGALISCLCEL